MPKNIVRIVDRDPDSLQLLRRIARTIAVNVVIGAIEVDVTVMAESRKRTAQHDALLLGYTGLVRHIAYHLFRRRNYVDVDDLIQAGMVALSETIRRHGHDTAGSFEAYASVRIRGAMLDFVRKSDWSLRSGRRGLRGIGDAECASTETGVIASCREMIKLPATCADRWTPSADGPAISFFDKTRH